jgi:hypothetical protein
MRFVLDKSPNWGARGELLKVQIGPLCFCDAEQLALVELVEVESWFLSEKGFRDPRV